MKCNKIILNQLNTTEPIIIYLFENKLKYNKLNEIKVN